MRRSDGGRFASHHPLVHMIYFLTVLLLCMFCRPPAFQLAGLMIGIVSLIRLQGKKGLLLYAWVGIPMAIYSLLINPLFLHRGETVLFSLFHHPITLEVFLYGGSAVVMVVTVAIWFGIMGSCLSSDRIYYLFSRISSRLALYFSMTLRSIPQLKERYEMVRQGQIALGAHTPDGRRKKLSQMGKELSILLSWSLEDSIEVSDSMEARGYGLKGRTSYRRYRMRKRDWILAALLICLSIPVWTAVLSGSLRLYFFPAYILPEWNRMTGCAFVFFVCLLLLPLAEDKAAELKNGREADADE